MTDRITHAQAYEAIGPIVPQSRFELLRRYVLQQQELDPSPSPEPSSKPGELARDGRAVRLLEARYSDGHDGPWSAPKVLGFTNDPASDWSANESCRMDVDEVGWRQVRVVEYVPREPAHAVDADEVELSRWAECLALGPGSSDGVGFECRRCSGSMGVDFGNEGTTLCHECAQEFVETMGVSAIAALRSRPAVVDAEVVRLLTGLRDYANDIAKDHVPCSPFAGRVVDELTEALRSLVGRKA